MATVGLITPTALLEPLPHFGRGHQKAPVKWDFLQPFKQSARISRHCARNPWARHGHSGSAKELLR
jgi:hypothetical protein